MTKTCKLCGRIFTTDKAAALYCGATCRKDAERIAQRKYNQNLRLKQRQEQRQEQKEDTTPAVKMTAIHNDVVMDTLDKAITDNLELLDAVREELQNILTDLKAKQSAYDKNDSDMLHLFETTRDKEKLLEYALKCSETRTQRRNYKNHIVFLINLLKQIPQNAKQSYDSVNNVQAARNTFHSLRNY